MKCPVSTCGWLRLRTSSEIKTSEFKVTRPHGDCVPSLEARVLTLYVMEFSTCWFMHCFRQHQCSEPAENYLSKSAFDIHKVIPLDNLPRKRGQGFGLQGVPINVISKQSFRRSRIILLYVHFLHCWESRFLKFDVKYFCFVYHSDEYVDVHR